MKIYTIHQAKTQLSRLIRQALTGDEVVIANRSKPLVKLQVLGVADRKALMGDLKGKIRMAPDFNSPLSDFRDYE